MAYEEMLTPKTIPTVEATIEHFKRLHDHECNQKYNKTLPYSFHLDMVAKQVNYFKYLLTEEDYRMAIKGAYGHDSIEDARVTYNDIKDKFGTELADIIYACTEEKGKERPERLSEKFYEELSKNRIATFVKLCDVIANVKFALLSNSSMYKKYQDEYDKVARFLYRDDFKDMFTYLAALLTVQFK